MGSDIRTVLIVGAGIAGLACARSLQDAGRAVTLMDKGRRPGGRVATRRADGMVFNHGAQFASARGPGFAPLVRRLGAAGQAAPWPEAGDGRFAFLPGMSALPAAMAQGLNILTERHAAFLHHGPIGWTVRHFAAADMRPGEVASAGGVLAGPFDAVLIAAPAPQAAVLLDTARNALAATARTAVIAPCWAVMARFPSVIDAPAVLRSRTLPIAWAAREAARPGGVAGPETWTLHASPAYSRASLEDPADSVGQAIVAAFRDQTGAPAADWVRAHRWRHALVEVPVAQPSLWDPVARLGACGDWCAASGAEHPNSGDRPADSSASGRIEAAFDSGVSLACRIIAPG